MPINNTESVHGPTLAEGLIFYYRLIAILVVSVLFYSGQETNAQDNPNILVTTIVSDSRKSFNLDPPSFPKVKGTGIGENGTRRKSLFVEFLGNGGTLTANYDTRLNVDRNDGLGIRVGIGLGTFHFLTSDPYWKNRVQSGSRYTSLPLQLNYIVGKRRSGFEAGIGITPEFTLNQQGDDPHVQFTGLLSFGYRLQPVNNGLSFRFLATPGLYQGRFFPIGAGISLGYSFKK